MATDHSRRRVLHGLALTSLLAGAGGCGGGSAGSPSPVVPVRKFKMGFFPTPSRPEAAVLLKGVDQFSERSELVHIHEELPWTDLLNGTSADAILERDKTKLIEYCRGKGLRLGFMADLTDGLSRADEAPQLRALGRSIAEPAVLRVYRDYVLSFVAKFKPDYIGVAAETNLIRALAPATVYASVVEAANLVAADLNAAAVPAPVFISVQAETAWGRLGGAGTYVGVERDFTDFPFTAWLGLSSYPYFAYSQPEDLPADYFTRLLAGRSTPLLVAEGGWASASVGTVNSSPDAQARYIARLGQLLDGAGAKAVIQTLFADIDLASVPPPVPSNLAAFVSLGLVDTAFAAKPALAGWDGLFARPLQ